VLTLQSFSDGAARVAAGSESLWLGEGWTKGIESPSPLPPPARGGKVLKGLSMALISLRQEKFREERR